MHPGTRWSVNVMTVGLASALAGCSGGGTRVEKPVDPGSAEIVASTTRGAPTAVGTAIVDPAGIACAPKTCVYHRGAGGYRTCLAGGARARFHFGAPCAPDDGCMFDSHDDRYRTCSKIVDGICELFAGACAPRSACLYQASDDLHHHCATVKDGRCAAPGPACSP